MIMQMDDPLFFDWAINASRRGGAFLSHLAAAALRADAENYTLLRPVLLEMRKKYPQYENEAMFGRKR